MGRVIKSAETKAERMQRRDNDVKSRYDELRDKKVHGVRKYSHEAVLVMVGYQFYLSPMHVNNIVNEWNSNKGTQRGSETEKNSD